MRILLALSLFGCNIKQGGSKSLSEPGGEPAQEPSASPTSEPTSSPTNEPNSQPSSEPSSSPTSEPASSPTNEPNSQPSNEPVELLDYTQAGPYIVTSVTKTAFVTNCDYGMEYVEFVPQGVSNPTLMVLGHGFLRSGKMVGWAEHYASWGIHVLAPTLCHYNVFLGVDHEMNGQNMMELAAQYGASSVIYGGQSAGGLAAIIAASQDQHAIGVLGMDATDTEGVPSVPDFIGQNYAGNVSVPGFAIVGEPSSCNSNNNGITLFEMMSTAQVLRVSSSDHCDYENPTDWGCETFCLNSTTNFDDSEIAPVIAQLSTAAVLALSGDTEAQAAWTNENLAEWITSGLVSRLR